MIKQKQRLAIGLLALSLVSCAKTSEVYPAGEYEGSLFEENFYLGRHDFAGKTCTEKASKTIESDSYFNGDNAEDFGSYSTNVTFDGNPLSRQGVKSMYPEVLNTMINGQSTALTTDVFRDWRYADVGRDGEFVGSSFGRTKCLATSDASFKNGFLSKLYDGQLYCHGDHMRALVQFDQNGYDTLFPKSMVSGDYFLISLRGGSNYLNLSGDPVSRLTEFDAHFKFYFVEKDGFTYDTVHAKDVVVRTDSGGEGVTWLGFKFSAIGLEATAGIIGFSFAFDNFRDPAIDISKESCNRSVDSSFYWGAMVYEVMFPDSSWE